MEWYYSIQGQRQGPTDLDTLKDMVAKGGLSASDYVWNQGMGTEWAKVSDIPVLGAFQEQRQDEAAQKKIVEDRLAERERMIAREKRRKITVLVASVVVAGLTVGGVLFVKTNKPYWQHGVSASTPMGTFEKLDALLVGEKQMTRAEVTDVGLIKKRSAKMFSYTDPQCERGKHISAQGSIVLMLDESDTLVGVVARFPSPGTHGAAIINKSVASLFMETYWLLVKKEEEGPHWTNAKKEPVGTAFGLPHDERSGAYRTIEQEDVRGLWLQYGPDDMYTIMHLYRTE